MQGEIETTNGAELVISGEATAEQNPAASFLGRFEATNQAATQRTYTQALNRAAMLLGAPKHFGPMLANARPKKRTLICLSIGPG